MSNPRAKRCVECGYWITPNTTVCYICGADQTAPERGKHLTAGTIVEATKRSPREVTSNPQRPNRHTTSI